MVNGPGQLPLLRLHSLTNVSLSLSLSTLSGHSPVVCVHWHIMDFLRVEWPFSCVCPQHLVSWLGDLFA